MILLVFDVIDRQPMFEVVNAGEVEHFASH